MTIVLRWCPTPRSWIKLSRVLRHPWVDEILVDVRDRADTLAKTLKPLSSILPRRLG